MYIKFLNLFLKLLLITITVSSESTVFGVCDKEPEPFKYSSLLFNNQKGSIYTDFKRSLHQKGDENRECAEILQATKFSKSSYFEVGGNGFIKTIIEAYNKHHNLVLRPDDVWTAIVTQFSFYVNKNSEKFRKKFVNFEGKKLLEVDVIGSITTADYGFIVKEFNKLIDKNLVDNNIKSWILPSFSTTTDNDIITCGVLFMATVQKYFEYQVNFRCGIPYISLEGTVEDWINVENRLEKLKEFDLQHWYKLLKPILQQFVKAKKGAPDLDFWNPMVNYHSDCTPIGISGWIISFCVFSVEGDWIGPTYSNDSNSTGRSFDHQVRIKSIPSAVVNVPITINNNGDKYNATMFAGHLGFKLYQDEETLEPATGWVFCLNNATVGVEAHRTLLDDEEYKLDFSNSLEFPNKTIKALMSSDFLNTGASKANFSKEISTILKVIIIHVLLMLKPIYSK